MKILHIGQMIGGLDIYIRNVTLYTQANFNYVIIRGESDQSKPIIKDGHAIKEYEVDLRRKISWKDILCLIQIVKIVRQEKPDLIHCHSSKGGVLGRIVGFVTGIKTLYTPHAFSFLSTESSLNRNLYLTIEKLTRFKAYVLACSISEARLAKAVVGYSDKKIYTWSNSVPDASKKIKPAQINIESPCISTIGRPSYQKNSLFLLQVAKLVIAKIPDIQFYILGVGHYSPYLRKVQLYISNNHLEKNIHLLQWISQNDAYQYIANSEIYLSTSRYEGLPLAIAEALSLSKPVIASNVVGNCDCVLHEKNGYLLDLDPNLFANKIIELLNDKPKQMALSVNSRKLFENQFDIEKRISLLEDIYKC